VRVCDVHARHHAASLAKTADAGQTS
jgi:hypothetical protein